MGVTYVQARLRRPDGRGPARNVRFLVDSGAIYSVLPEEIWRALRLKPERQVEFTLADGTPIERGVSECRFEIRGEETWAWWLCVSLPIASLAMYGPSVGYGLYRASQLDPLFVDTPASLLVLFITAFAFVIPPVLILVRLMITRRDLSSA